MWPFSLFFKKKEPEIVVQPIVPAPPKSRPPIVSRVLSRPAKPVTRYSGSGSNKRSETVYVDNSSNDVLAFAALQGMSDGNSSRGSDSAPSDAGTSSSHSDAGSAASCASHSSSSSCGSSGGSSCGSSCGGGGGGD